MPGETPDIIVFRSREEWHNWLLSNADTIREQWIAIFKKKFSHKGLTYDEAVEEAICFGWIDGMMRSVDEEKFMLRFSPRKKGSPWSLINKNRALKMIETGKIKETGLKMIEDAKNSGWWDKAYSMKGEQKVPRDMKEALQGNKGAWKKFNNLSNSDKSRYIFWVESAKRQETRERRIESVIDKMG